MVQQDIETVMGVVNKRTILGFLMALIIAPLVLAGFNTFAGPLLGMHDQKKAVLANTNAIIKLDHVHKADTAQRKAEIETATKEVKAEIMLLRTDIVRLQEAQQQSSAATKREAEVSREARTVMMEQLGQLLRQTR